MFLGFARIGKEAGVGPAVGLDLRQVATTQAANFKLLGESSASERWVRKRGAISPSNLTQWRGQFGHLGGAGRLRLA